jgi:hypothetical protein
MLYLNRNTIFDESHSWNPSSTPRNTNEPACQNLPQLKQMITDTICWCWQALKFIERMSEHFHRLIVINGQQVEAWFIPEREKTKGNGSQAGFLKISHTSIKYCAYQLLKMYIISTSVYLEFGTCTIPVALGALVYNLSYTGKDMTLISMYFVRGFFVTTVIPRNNKTMWQA